MTIKSGMRLVAILLASTAIGLAASQASYAHGGQGHHHDHGGYSPPPPNHGPGSSHNPIIVHPVHGPGSSHNPIIYKPIVRDHRPAPCHGGFHPGRCRSNPDNAPGGVTVTSDGGRITSGFNGNVRDHR
jgi:hypothetical protein